MLHKATDARFAVSLGDYADRGSCTGDGGGVLFSNLIVETT